MASQLAPASGGLLDGYTVTAAALEGRMVREVNRFPGDSYPDLFATSVPYLEKEGGTCSKPECPSNLLGDRKLSEDKQR